MLFNTWARKSRTYFYFERDVVSSSGGAEPRKRVRRYLTERESVAALALCQYQTEFTMAEWQYRIERTELKSETDLDSELEKILEDYGQQGWELVQVWPGQETLDNSVCRLIFKIEKPVLAH
jgi:hypothetical protein